MTQFKYVEMNVIIKLIYTNDLLFLSAGNVLSEERYPILPEMANMVIFLQKHRKCCLVFSIPRLMTILLLVLLLLFSVKLLQLRTVQGMFRS